MPCISYHGVVHRGSTGDIGPICADRSDSVYRSGVTGAVQLALDSLLVIEDGKKATA